MKRDVHIPDYLQTKKMLPRLLHKTIRHFFENYKQIPNSSNKDHFEVNHSSKNGLQHHCTKEQPTLIEDETDLYLIHFVQKKVLPSPVCRTIKHSLRIISTIVPTALLYIGSSVKRQQCKLAVVLKGSSVKRQWCKKAFYVKRHTVFWHL